MTYFKAAAAVAVMSLSACGGSGTPVDEQPDTVTPEEQLQAYDERGNDIFETSILGEDVLARSALPTSGAAHFSGPLIARGGVGNPVLDPEQVQVRVLFIGEVDLTADFADDSIAGVATDFIDVENIEEFGDDGVTFVSGGEVAGSLTFTGDLADTTEATFELLATGGLEGPNGSFLNYTEVGGSADVYGAGAEALDIGGGALVTFDGEEGFISYTGVAGR